MASDGEYLNYVLETLRYVEGITCKRMMGEYLLYKNGVLFGGVYDNRFLLKVTNATASLPQAISYPGAKKMAVMQEEDPLRVAEIVDTLVDELNK